MSSVRQQWSAAPVGVRLAIAALYLGVAVGIAVVVTENLVEADGPDAAAVAGSAYGGLVLLAVATVLALLLLRRSRTAWVIAVLYGLLGLVRSPDSVPLRLLSWSVVALSVLPLLTSGSLSWFFWHREQRS